MSIPVQGEIIRLGSLVIPIVKEGLGLGRGYFSSIFETLRRLKLERPIRDRVYERSEAEQIVWECELTNSLQEQLDMTNTQLKNFQLILKMEEQSKSVIA